MDPNFSHLYQEIQNVHMEVKQVQFAQASQAERLLRLERRQADDAAIKSVWNSPFPSVLGGTPQHGPVQMPANEVFDDFDEQGQSLLGSLHLEADDEPIRRGAASRANSVRFDESTLQGSNWGQASRHSGEFTPARPGSGMGGHALMERSLSHRSDGRHSSAGHSVHSMHSVVSGRASSLGLDNNFLLAGRDEDGSPIDMPEAPPPGFLYLGSVPSIVRCWLTTNYAHDTLLYADVCSGSQKSTLDYSLAKELGLLDEVHGDVNGAARINLTVYFAEATVMQPHSRSASPSRQVPYINADFEVVGTDQVESADGKKLIRVFIGSDILRANSADLLLSQNRMTLYGNGDESEKISVPFVRPEDDAVFKHIMTTNVVPEKARLRASAPEFVSKDPKAQNAPLREKVETATAAAPPDDGESVDALSPTSNRPGQPGGGALLNPASESGDSDRPPKAAAAADTGSKEAAAGAEDRRRDTVGGIWGSWRHGTSTSGSESGQRENGLSGYQPATRSRNMKVLKPQKTGGSSSTRAVSSYEPPASARPGGEPRRKSLASTTASDQNSTASGPVSSRWETARQSANGSAAGSAASGPEPKSRSSLDLRGLSSAPAAPRSANPIGGASAFSWMAPSSGGKPKTPTAAAE